MRAVCGSLFLGALWLAGCAIAHDAAAPDPRCVVRVDAMPLRRVHDFMLLPAALDGRAVQMVLDTGAEISTLSPGIAASLGLRNDPARGRLLLGVGGDVRTGSVAAPAFALGDAPPRPAQFSLNTVDLLPGQAPPVGGLLGADQIAGRDLDLNSPAGWARLVTVANCRGFQPWPDASGAPLLAGQYALSFVNVAIDGRSVRALIDTGARETFVTRRLAASLGVTGAMLEADPASIALGVSRAEIEVRHHVFGSIALGRVVWPNVSVGIADLRLPGADMLLGADLLGRQRIWISSSYRMLWLR